MSSGKSPFGVRMARNLQQRLMEIRGPFANTGKCPSAPNSSKRAKEGRTNFEALADNSDPVSPGPDSNWGFGQISGGTNAERASASTRSARCRRSQCYGNLSTSILTGRCGPADGSCDGHSKPNGASGSNIPNRHSRDNHNRIRNHTDRNRHRRGCGPALPPPRSRRPPREPARRSPAAR